MTCSANVFLLHYLLGIHLQVMSIGADAQEPIHVKAPLQLCPSCSICYNQMGMQMEYRCRNESQIAALGGLPFAE